MKKILFTLVVTMIISSCDTKREETTFIVKFKDGIEMKVVGTTNGGLPQEQNSDFRNQTTI